MKEVSKLGQLQVLDLRGRSGNPVITNAGLKQIAKVKNLRELYVSCTRIGDPGVKELSNLQHLEKLWLQGTGMTDKGMLALVNCKQLRSLFAAGTNITIAGVREFNQRSPKGTVLWNGPKYDPNHTETGVPME